MLKFREEGMKTQIPGTINPFNIYHVLLHIAKNMLCVVFERQAVTIGVF